VQSSWGGEQFELPGASEARLSLKAWATEDAVRRLVKSGGQDLDKLIEAAHSRDFKPVPLGVTTSIAFSNQITHVKTANVGGVLPGNDPKLAPEVVDNASGCAQVLAIARTFAMLPARPRRTIMALFVAGEERGLLGSAYYARNPSFPPGRIAADINIDGGNILGRTRDATLVSLGKSSLDQIAERLAQMQGRKLLGDQYPDRGYYYRSDQFSFAKIGVPALFFNEGTEVIGKPAGWGKQQHDAWELKQYHQPSDKLEASWNLDGMIEDAQLDLYAGWLVAQADAMPTWNPGDEFVAARQRAIAELAVKKN
jgi:Zn-dependent M28 family amino/carboxypeptidase